MITVQSLEPTDVMAQCVDIPRSKEIGLSGILPSSVKSGGIAGESQVEFG